MSFPNKASRQTTLFDLPNAKFRRIAVRNRPLPEHPEICGRGDQPEVNGGAGKPTEVDGGGDQPKIDGGGDQPWVAGAGKPTEVGGGEIDGAGGQPEIDGGGDQLEVDGGTGGSHLGEEGRMFGDLPDAELERSLAKAEEVQLCSLPGGVSLPGSRRHQAPAHQPHYV